MGLFQYALIVILWSCGFALIYGVLLPVLFPPQLLEDNYNGTITLLVTGYFFLWIYIRSQQRRKKDLINEWEEVVFGIFLCALATILLNAFGVIHVF